MEVKGMRRVRIEILAKNKSHGNLDLQVCDGFGRGKLLIVI